MAPTSPSPTVQTFELPEDAVAERLGISRAQLRSARGPENLRWAYGPNRRVLWSEKGVGDLQADIAGPPQADIALPQGLSVLVVWNPAVPNRRTLVAYRKGMAPENATPEDRCVVYLGANGDNRRFVPEMEILARHHRGATWWFEGNPAAPENGRRMPRRIGRW